MQIQTLAREFRYNGVVLADPNHTFSLEQVRDFYATVYPEITSADIEGPEQLGAKVVYTFRRAVGTKGADTIKLVTDLGEPLRAGWLTPDDAEFVKSADAALREHGTDPMTPSDHARLLALHAEYCALLAA